MGRIDKETGFRIGTRMVIPIAGIQADPFGLQIDTRSGRLLFEVRFSPLNGLFLFFQGCYAQIGISLRGQGRIVGHALLAHPLDLLIILFM